LLRPGRSVCRPRIVHEPLVGPGKRLHIAFQHGPRLLAGTLGAARQGLGNRLIVLLPAAERTFFDVQGAMLKQ
jgi:hypothetical protein